MFFTDANTEDLVSGDNGYNWCGNSLTYDDRPYTSRESQIVWNDYYMIIFSANTVIGAMDATSESPLIQYYLAQALAARGFCYLELAQLYQFNYKGHESSPCVPLITDKNSEAAALNGAPRASVDSVYAQVNADLSLAIDLLTKAQGAGQKRSDRRYVDLAVVYGLRARMNLAMQNWSAAAADAQAAINNTDARPATIAEVNDTSNGITTIERRGCSIENLDTLHTSHIDAIQIDIIRNVSIQFLSVNQNQDILISQAV